MGQGSTSGGAGVAPLAPWPGTFFQERAQTALLAEIGELHLQLREARESVRRAGVLRAWLHAQPVIFSPSICCPGSELEERIQEADACEELQRFALAQAPGGRK